MQVYVEYLNDKIIDMEGALQAAKQKSTNQLKEVKQESEMQLLQKDREIERLLGKIKRCESKFNKLGKAFPEIMKK